MTFETDRASRLLDQGAPLVGTLRGSARLAVAGYLAGGRAALAAISKQHYDVLAGTPRGRKPRLAAELAKAYLRGGEQALMDLTEAYRECERITWSQARNFAYGIRLLPPAKRRGLAVVYAFARRIDDIGDGTLPPSRRSPTWRPPARPFSTSTGAQRALDDPVLLALADTERNFPVPMEAFGELIDGCVADVRGTHYETFEDLHYHCRCVAGWMRRLSLGIFGTSHDLDEAARLADSLGVALQLTNILRDIREDRQNGRIYLPAEDLAKFDVDPADLGGSGLLVRGP